MTVTVIDLESTGLDPAVDAIIELAALDFASGGAGITNRREHLICPPVPVPPEASSVHHLIDEDLVGKPPLREVIEHYEGSCAYVAHNCSFERSFLEQHLGTSRKTGQPPVWICTYRIALRLYPEATSHSNQTLRYQLGLLNPFGIDRHSLVAHRAMSDVIVTAAIFAEMRKFATWSQMQLWSSEPPLETVIRFGKHKGTRYAEAPQDYLEWMLRQQDMDEGKRFSAEHWLNQRRAAA